jgi:hypothetical protein
MTVCAGAGATSSDLYPEPVIQKFCYKVMMDIVNIKGEYSQSLFNVAGQDMKALNFR